MTDLTTTYLGLSLKSPLVASAGPLCDSVDKIRRLEDAGIAAPLPDGAFYLWVPVPSWASEEAGGSGHPSGAFIFVRALAETAGMLVSPGDLYGDHSPDHVRIAVVQPDDRIELVARRLESNRHRLGA